MDSSRESQRLDITDGNLLMWLGIVIVGVLIVWTVGGLASLDLLPQNVSKHFNTPEKRVAWAVRIFAGFLTIVGIASYAIVEKGILHDFSTEMIGIGIGVWGIDELNRRRSVQEYKRGIIQQMASRSNDFALDAARIANNEGWLQDGSFKGERLTYVNLKGAGLWKANLEGANLRFANLERADIGKANLKGVDLQGANLKGAFLLKANFTRANLKFANLEGAIYDKNTNWPDSFDPKEKGAINKDELSEDEEEDWLKKYRPGPR
jgi:hypothetical protein